MIKRSPIRLLIAFSIISVFVNNIDAQINSPDADYRTQPYYTSDSAYIFCAKDEFDYKASLTAKSLMRVNSVFLWEEYDSVSSGWNQILETDTIEESTIKNLMNGLYRVTVKGNGTIEVYSAWVFNNWIKVTKSEIPDSSSTCDGFKIWSDFVSAPLYYYDTKTNERHSLRNPEVKFKFRWYEGSDLVISAQNPYIIPPKASDSPIKYRLVVIDEFACEGEGTVDYNSKVPKTAFTFTPSSGEAVLKVEFGNESINYDSVLWFFYKDLNIIKAEAEENEDEVVDSIDFVLTDDVPVYEYEHTGQYKVKVITVHINEITGNCYDTLYMKAGEYINVDTSLVILPNVFTPNGDGMNDIYVVKSQSLKSMTIKIYNRWGGLVHSWSYSNIKSKDYTIEHSVWDGRIGGAMASPGVYYVVVRAVGRDSEERNQKGFVHLFRPKD